MMTVARKLVRYRRGERLTFAGALRDAILAALEQERRDAIARERIDQRDVLAFRLARELGVGDLGNHVRAIADNYGVPEAIVRNGVALALARSRVREHEARQAVQRRTAEGR